MLMTASAPAPADVEPAAACVQVRYLLAALRSKAMAGAWLQHAALGTVAIVAFAAEEKAIQADVDWLHAVWHCGAAASMGRLLPLLLRQESLVMLAA